MTAEMPGAPLRIAILGDFDGPHTRRWLEFYVERGHEMHAISYYRPQARLPGVQLHVLTGDKAAPSTTGGNPTTRSWLKRLIPVSVQRQIQSRRYLRAGLIRTLAEIKPDVFHAHYLVEHGYYGSFAKFHPYVVSGWGSDVFVDAQTWFGARIARHALAAADLVTANDPAMAQALSKLGVPSERLFTVPLGVDPVFLETGGASVNVAAGAGQPPTVISDRALEPNYNVDTVVRAFAILRMTLPKARLVIAGDGSQREAIERFVLDTDLSSVTFTGHLDAQALMSALDGAQVYVSVPSSDSMPLSTLEAMARGAFPVVSDLPSQDGWVTDGVNGLRVTPRDSSALAEAIHKALTDPELRRTAVATNRELVETRGSRAASMLTMERAYYGLAGRPVAGDMAI